MSTLKPVRRRATVITGSLLGLCTSVALGVTGASAAGLDSDHDGMPNRWERVHGLNPEQANARGDKDHDGLHNLGEYRHGVDPADPDSDNDGHDDGDEISDGYGSTNVGNGDTDDDGVLDGDEDGDHDQVDNEDEDDAVESCTDDDADRDLDNVDDEDENELHLRAGDRDSDDDGVLDGDEDRDHYGVANEDNDDSDDDECDGDGDHNGEADEDEGDILGTIVSFEETSGALQIAGMFSTPLMFVVTDDTEIEFEHSGDEGTTADLVNRTQVAEVDLEDDGTLEKIELYRAT